MQKNIQTTADLNGLKLFSAFGQWFATLYFGRFINIFISDGAGDGKVDVFISYQKGKHIHYAILNTKYTSDYDKSSPVSFYDEITRFWSAFENKNNRKEYLQSVRELFRPKYIEFFKHYDDGIADLYFVTNHKINPIQFNTVKKYRVRVFHLDDILQYLSEELEVAMPESTDLILSDIPAPMTPPPSDTYIPTSIVFARLVDFLDYMSNDPYDLLFARNVRLWLGNTETNKEIRKTFEKYPTEFAYSNNGITILCKKHNYDVGKRELRLENPRIVNGSQTLHSIRGIAYPSSKARVMVRIVEIPSKESDFEDNISMKKDIIHKISIRSNMQNPIKKWNLVSHDDFQNELFRFFWNKKLYYERRQNEWKFKKMELRSIGISQGPDIRKMTQIIASYYYNKKGLGPAEANGRLNDLFDEDAYKHIRDTSPELTYQLYLVNELMRYYLNELRRNKKYIFNVQTHIKYCLFTLICRVLDSNGIKWGSDEVTKLFEYELYDEENSVWRELIKSSIDYILTFYKKQEKLLKKKHIELTYPNYFKNRTQMQGIFNRDIPVKLRTLCKKAL
jgi:uncharacterized spore protein YtfJ